PGDQGSVSMWDCDGGVNQKWFRNGDEIRSRMPSHRTGSRPFFRGLACVRFHPRRRGPVRHRLLPVLTVCTDGGVSGWSR
ncbi:hypothetical protein ACWC9H_14570, partial [Streptomyces sp. NPDC001251]